MKRRCPFLLSLPTLAALMSPWSVGMELGASGREAVLVKDPAASGGEAAAVQIGVSGEGFGARWLLGEERVGPGLFSASVTLRLHLPEGFDRNRLRIILTWVADDRPIVTRTVSAAALDRREGKYTPISTSFSLTNLASLALACRWQIEPLPPGEVQRPAYIKPALSLPARMPVERPTMFVSGSGESGLEALMGELAAEQPVEANTLPWPAIFLDQVELIPVAQILAVEQIRPEKVHVYPGETNPIRVVVRNYGHTPREALLRFTIRRGLAEVSPPTEARITFPAHSTAEHVFIWVADSREYGHEAHVEVEAEGKILHATSELFTVSESIWKTAIQGPGFVAWYGREHQFSNHVAANRRRYVNVEEAFSWQPSSWTDLNPTGQTWWSGQNNYHNSMKGLRLWHDLSRGEGIKLITYMWATASGWAGAEWVRRHPDRVALGRVGFASEFHDVEDLRLAPFCQARSEFWSLQYGVWHSFDVDRGQLRTIEAGAEEIIRSARQFGWAGVRFDCQLSWGARDATEIHRELREMGMVERMQQWLPEAMRVTTGQWPSIDVSLRNVHYMKSRLWEALGTRFAIAMNHGPIPLSAEKESDAHTRRYLKAFCSGGAQINQEYLRHVRSWSEFYSALPVQVEQVRRFGGFHAVQCMDKPGGDLGRAWNILFILAAGSHPYNYVELETSPGCYARFATRYGEFLWDPLLEPIDADAEGWSIEAPGELLWKPFLKRKRLSSGARTVIHLITPPPGDASSSTPQPAPFWMEGIRIRRATSQLPRSVWYLSAEPDVHVERLKCEREGKTVAVRLPEHRLWSVVVWEEEAGEQP